MIKIQKQRTSKSRAMVFNSENCPKGAGKLDSNLSQFDNILTHRELYITLNTYAQEMLNGSKSHIKPLISNLYNSLHIVHQV